MVYARRGWEGFPCKARAKNPATKNGFLDATIDPAQLADWWGRDPCSNVAIRTGEKSGLVVLDIDGEDGFAALDELERRHGDLPATASVRTPRGGSHFYFRHPGIPIRSRQAFPGPGLDVRGDGGYVLAPPSIGPNGQRYEVEDDEEISPLPCWLLRLLLT
jgi:hypothetical protein